MTDTGICQKQRRTLFELGPRYRGRLRSAAVRGGHVPGLFRALRARSPQPRQLSKASALHRQPFETYLLGLEPVPTEHQAVISAHPSAGAAIRLSLCPQTATPEPHHDVRSDITLRKPLTGKKKRPGLAQFASP